MVFRDTKQHRFTSLGLAGCLAWLCVAAGAPAFAQQQPPQSADSAQQAQASPAADAAGQDQTGDDESDSSDESASSDGSASDDEPGSEARAADSSQIEAAAERETAGDAAGPANAGVDDDAGGDAQVQAFKKAYGRYSREMKDYQDTVDSIVDAEYDQRVAQVNSVYDNKISGLEAVERARRDKAIAAFKTYLERYPDTPGYTPDALFRLAELQFEKANADYLRADEAYQDNLEAYEAGKRADPPQVPRRDYTETVELFRQLVDDWPDYNQVDGAYYLLAYCKLQVGEDKVARDLLAELIESHPDSRFVPEAWVRIGEYWFAYADGPQDLEKARHAYDQAMQYSDSKFYDKALYKLAWTYYRLDNFERAIDEFKRLVKYSDDQKEKTGKSGSVLRAEAVQYIAVSLAEEDWDLDGSVDAGFGLERAKKYLGGDEPYEREVLVQLVDYMFENTRYAIAADVINYTLQKYPRDAKNPQLHEKLILSLVRDGRQDAAFAERRKLLNYYGPDSDWYQYQKRVGHAEAVQYSNNLVRDNLIQSATWFHEQAQKLKNEAVVRQDAAMLAQARDKYATAAAAYQGFLQRYPNDKDIYQWNFYYAECLYYSEQYIPAYEQYRVVRELDVRDNKYQEKAAFNAIKALEFKLRSLVERGELSERAVPGSAAKDARDAAQKQENTEASTDKIGERDGQKLTIEPDQIPAMTQNYITALDRYVVLGLQNANNPDLDAKFAFQSAKLFYDFKDFDTARERFSWIVNEYPDNELAYLSGSLILETYRREHDYENLALWADKLSKVIKGDQAEAIKQEVRQFKLGAMFKSAEQLFAAKKYEKAAAEYLKLVNNSGQEQLEYKDKALNNAAVAYEKIGKYESAMNLYERVYTEPPDTPLSGYALYRVGVNSERFFDFDKAIQSYLLFYDKFDGKNPKALQDMGFSVDQKRQNALRSASVLAENMQRYTKAAELYGKYVRAYPGADDAEGAQWRTLNSWKKAGNSSKMLDAIATYRRQFGSQPDKASRVLEAMTMVASYHEDRGDQQAAQKQYQDIVAEYDSRQPGQQGSASFYAAKARFMLAERAFQDWKAIKINGSMKQQGRLLKKKIRVQKEVAKKFKKVWTYGSLEWTLASSFRIGSLYQSFAETLYDVPIPFDQGTPEWNSYRTQLDEMVVPLEDKAIDHYETTIQKARQDKVVNKWTKKTLEELNKYKPDQYPLYKEERQEVSKATRTGGSFVDVDGYNRRNAEPDSTAIDQDGPVGSNQATGR